MAYSWTMMTGNQSSIIAMVYHSEYGEVDSDTIMYIVDFGWLV